MSEIERDHKWLRPTFNFKEREGNVYTTDDIAAQLLESLRNVCEQIRDKQILQCDVRADICAIRIALQKIAARKRSSKVKTKSRKKRH